MNQQQPTEGDRQSESERAHTLTGMQTLEEGDGGPIWGPAAAYTWAWGMGGVCAWVQRKKKKRVLLEFYWY